MRLRRRFGVEHDGENRVVDLRLHQRRENSDGVGCPAGAGIVLHVGEDDRLARGDGTCGGDRLLRRLQPRRELGLARHDRGDEAIRGRIGQRLRVGVGEHDRGQHRRVRHREGRQQRHRRHARFGLDARELGIDRLARIGDGGLAMERHQEGQRPPRLAQPAAREQALHQRVGAAARLAHVDVRVGAVRDHRIGDRRHRRADIAVQVERAHDRHRGPDDRAHAAHDLGFRIVVVIGHHRAMQVEIDGVEPSGLNEALDHLRHHALEGIARHGAARLGRAPHQRHHFVAGRRRGGDEAAARTRQLRVGGDVAAVQEGQARRPRGEVRVGRRRRREGVGLVQEAREGNARHGGLRQRSTAGPLP